MKSYKELISIIEIKKQNEVELFQHEKILDCLLRSKKMVNCTFFAENLHIRQYVTRIYELRHNYNIPILNKVWYQEIDGKKVRRSSYWIDRSAL